MTNEMIIFQASQDLAKQGKLNYTGRTFTATVADGSKVTIKETEEIHTFAAWKQMGYMVQKGEKAIAKIAIWKYTEQKAKKTENGTAVETEAEGRMFKTTAAFFSRSQVKELEAVA